MPAPLPGHGPASSEAPIFGKIEVDALPERYHRQLNFRWWAFAIIASAAIWAVILLR